MVHPTSEQYRLLEYPPDVSDGWTIKITVPAAQMTEHGPWIFDAQVTIIQGDAEGFMVGNVRHDGCCNFQPASGFSCWHSCSKEQAMQIGIVMGMIYDAVAEMMGDCWTADR